MCKIKLHGKRLPERGLFFQLWRVHFACGSSRICVWVLSVKSCDKPLFFSFFFVSNFQVFVSHAFQDLSQISIGISWTWGRGPHSVQPLFGVLEGTWRIKSVASRACWKLLEEAKSVASRACWKVPEEVKSVASRACWKVPEEVKSVASRACWKVPEEVKSVASRACWKVPEEVKSVASRAC